VLGEAWASRSEAQRGPPRDGAPDLCARSVLASEHTVRSRQHFARPCSGVTSFGGWGEPAFGNSEFAHGNVVEHSSSMHATAGVPNEANVPSSAVGGSGTQSQIGKASAQSFAYTWVWIR
jgi:hypothetical protein